MLNGRHRVQRHPDGRDDDEGDGYDGDDLGGEGGVRLLDEVPQAALILHKLPVAEVLLHLLLDVVRLLLHLLDDVLLAGVVLVLAAGLQEDLVDHPVLEVVAEGEDAHLVDDVELAGAVEVEDGVEGARMAVEEVLVVNEAVGVAEVQDVVVGGRLHQLPCSTAQGHK